MIWSEGKKHLRNAGLALLILGAVPAMVLAQNNKKPSPPPKAAPAPKAAPQQQSRPAPNVQRPTTPSGGRPTTPSGGSTRPGGATSTGNTRPGGATSTGNTRPGGTTRPGSSTSTGNTRPGAASTPNSTRPGSATATGNTRPGSSTATGNTRPGSSNSTGTGNTRPGSSTATGNTRPGSSNPATSTRPGGGNNTVAGGNGSRPGGANTANGGRGGVGNASPHSAGGGAFSANNRPAPTRTATNTRGDKVAYNGKRVSGVTTHSGNEGVVNSRGRVTSIRTSNGSVIQRGPRGERTVVTERADHSRVVSYGHGRGYVQHGFSRGGHEYARRTYVYGGRSYTRVYRTYYYHGGAYYHYVPAYYYGPRFYGWAYNPWATPVAYVGWGWGGAPWYGYYGFYFTPAPVYATPSLWLTDYIIAANLQAAYEAQAQNLPPGEPADNQGATAITPEMKQLIAAEVQRQLAAERDSAAKGGGAPGPDSGNGDVPPPALDPAQSMFIVSSSLDVPVGTDTCSLTAGDMVERLDDTPGDDNAVAVRVVSSKPQDCKSGQKPRLQVADLQEMSNDFREKLDTGLGSLADNQGKSGLPGAPPAGRTEVADAKVAVDLSAVNDLKAQQQDADSAEQDVQQATASSGGN